MFLERDDTDVIESGEPIGGGNFGIMNFGVIEEIPPDWFGLDEGEFLTPGAEKAEELIDEPHFLRDLPRDAYNDRATREVIEFDSQRNPTFVVGREYLLSDRSDLIKDSATLMQDKIRSLSPTIMSREPVLAKLVTNEVASDGHILDGEVRWMIELSASNQPGVHRTWQSTPTKKIRVEVPMKVVAGELQNPNIFLLASNRVYPFTLEGCQLALDWHKKPLVRKRPPQVELSWQRERDYRSF